MELYRHIKTRTDTPGGLDCCIPAASTSPQRFPPAWITPGGKMGWFNKYLKEEEAR